MADRGKFWTRWPMMLWLTAVWVLLWGDLTVANVVVGLVLGALGFGGIGGAFIGIAKILFFIALALFLIFLALGVMAGKKVKDRLD